MVKENDSSKLKNEISLLTKRLSELNFQKQQKIQEIQVIKKDIKKLLTQFKENKRPKISEELKKLKEERDSHNNKVKELITSLKDIKTTNTDISKKSKLKINPLELKRRIDSIEEIIQTEVISFEKEKKLMLELKKLKSDFKNSGELFLNNEKIEKTSRNIKEEKDKANEIHRKIREILNINKEKNKEFKTLFKDLDDLREKDKVKQAEITELNNNIDPLNKELNEKLAAIGQARYSQAVEVELRKDTKKKMQERLIEEKSKIVEAKLKSKGKLTKEDLLIYQSKPNHDE